MRRKRPPWSESTPSVSPLVGTFSLIPSLLRSEKGSESLTRCFPYRRKSFFLGRGFLWHLTQASDSGSSKSFSLGRRIRMRRKWQPWSESTPSVSPRTGTFSLIPSLLRSEKGSESFTRCFLRLRKSFSLGRRMRPRRVDLGLARVPLSGQLSATVRNRRPLSAIGRNRQPLSVHLANARARVQRHLPLVLATPPSPTFPPSAALRFAPRGTISESSTVLPVPGNCLP